MQWDDETMSISMAVKRLNEFVQPRDLVLVKGEQRVFQVRAWLPWHLNIQELASPVAMMQKMTAFTDVRRHSCSLHRLTFGATANVNIGYQPMCACRKVYGIYFYLQSQGMI